MSSKFDQVLEHYGLFLDSDMYKVVCPFHGDLNPSLQINREKGFFYCYGCGVKGNELDLVRLHNPKMNKLQLGIELGKITKGKSTSKGDFIKGPVQILNPTRLSQKEAITQARVFYFTLPDPNWYRPSTNPTISEETRQAKRYMQGRGFTTSLLDNMGAKPSLNSSYPIVFPILENDRFRGYVMRTFDPEIEAKRKYLYNKGFRRQLTLPGHYAKGEPVVVVEGYLDCLKAIQLGVTNVVALLGWKISKKQLRKLVRYKVPTIICALDNDEAGDKGYAYLKEVCKPLGIKVKRLHYPEGIKDFGDLRKKTPELKKVKKDLYKFFN